MSRSATAPAQRPRRHRRGTAGGAFAACALAVLAGCAAPLPPAWQGDARSALDAAVAAQLSGDSRLEALEFARARSHIARTGRPELMARAELMRCAARVASLAFEPCEGYERLRADAAAPERAYAAYLAGERLGRDDFDRLPAAQRGAAAAVAGTPQGAGEAARIEDPLARLIAIAVLFRAGRADPPLIAAAADTASEQGWRRPLLAWLGVQAMLAERRGDAAERERLQRRIELASEAR